MNSKPEWPVLILKIKGITPLIAPPGGWLGGSRRGETMQRNATNKTLDTTSAINYICAGTQQETQPRFLHLKRERTL